MDLPIELYAVRHGESTANQVLIRANRNGDLETDLSGRDGDIPLTAHGRRQSGYVGRWLHSLRPPPDVVVCSSFLRAKQTTGIALHTAALRLPVEIDARMRDRELGEWELLTRAAVHARFPEEVVRRREVGELDHRPPGGESFRDVKVRVSDALHDIGRRHHGRRVLVVAHDAVVLMLRAVIEGLGDTELQTIEPVRNGSVTWWSATPDGLRLRTYNSVAHLR
ncbi:MAG: histidine phosphatase family protein [Micromonosporaceae bacterium]